MDIIINADDFGRSKEVNNAIADSFRNSLISDASLMCTCQDFLIDASKEEYLKLFNCAIGIHFCLTLGKPLSEEMKKNPLFCENGFFKTTGFKLFFCSIKNYKHIKAEFAEQVKLAKKLGWNISHADTHQHIHLYLPVLLAAISVCKKNNIKTFRVLNDKHYSFFKKLYVKIINFIIKCNGLKKTDRIFDFYKDDISHLSVKTKGATEVMVHPYYEANVIIDKSSDEELCKSRELEEEINELNSFAKKRF